MNKKVNEVWPVIKKRKKEKEKKETNKGTHEIEDGAHAGIVIGVMVFIFGALVVTEENK